MEGRSSETDDASRLPKMRSPSLRRWRYHALELTATPVRVWLNRSKARRLLMVVLWLLIAVGLATRVREAFVHNPLNNIFSDAQRHWDHAREPLAPSPWAIIDPPAYQIWLSIVQKWSLGAPELVALCVGSLSAVTPFLWYLFLREYLRSRLLSLVGFALLSWLPSWIAIYSYFMTETLLLPLLGASLWLTVRADRRRTVSSFCGMTALWTLTALTRGIALPLGGLAGLWVWLRGGHKVRTAAASLLVVVAMTGPLAIRNHHFLRLWSPFGTGWPIQIYATSGKKTIHVDMRRDDASWTYEFGSPSLYAKQLAPFSDWESVRNGVVSISIDLGKGNQDWESAYEKNAKHGLELLRLRWENVILVMLGPSWPDNNPEYSVARVAVDMRWIWAPLFIVVVLASFVAFRETRRRPLLPVLILAWFAVQGVSLLAVNEGRYRKPLEGLLVAQLLVLVEAPWASRRRLKPPALDDNPQPWEAVDTVQKLVMGLFNGSPPPPAEVEAAAQRIERVRRAARDELRSFLAVQGTCRGGPACCAALVRAWFGLSSLDAVLSDHEPPQADDFAGWIERDDAPQDGPPGLRPRGFSRRVLAAARADLAADAPGPGEDDLAQAGQKLLADFAEVERRARHKLRVLRPFRPRWGRIALVAILAGACVALGFALYRPRWRVSYFGNRALSGEPAIVTEEFSPNHDWGYDGPLGVPADKFSATFETCLVLDAPAEVLFSLGSDDGSRLLLDGRTVIDLWSLHAYTKQEQAVRVDAGAHLLRVEYNDEGGLARLTFDATRVGSLLGSLSRSLRLPARGSSSCGP